MRSWISLALLFAVVAGLGAFVYYRPAPGPQAERHSLSELKPQDVKRIRLEPRAEGAVAIVLERSAEAWRMVEPYLARADSHQIERLLSILEARSIARYPVANLARYGLDQPGAKLTLNEQTFTYGAVNTTTREQYVLTRDTVYAIPLAQRTALPREPSALISRSLFDSTEIPVRLEGPGFLAALEDGVWKITPSADNLVADERNAWVDAWRNATAVQVARYDGRPAPEEIAVALKDGRALKLAIVQREPELVLARTDEGVEYHFFAQTAKRLLTPPQPKNP